MRVDELVGSIQTYELTLPSSQKPKDFAFKAFNNDEKDIEIPHDITRDELAHMVKGLGHYAHDCLSPKDIKKSMQATWSDTNSEESASTTFEDVSRAKIDPIELWHRRLGKQTKSSHKKVKKIRTIRPLDLLQMSLWEKSKAIEHLKSLFNKVQVEISHPIIRIRSDRERV
ncbi:hypothetical protein AAG906_021581 [Vitis piasezkii]